MDNPVKGCLQFFMILLLPIMVVGGFAAIYIWSANVSFQENQRSLLATQSTSELESPLKRRQADSSTTSEIASHDASKSQSDPSKNAVQRKEESSSRLTSSTSGPSVSHSNEVPVWYETPEEGRQVVKTSIESPENVLDALDERVTIAAREYLAKRFGDTCAKWVNLDRQLLQDLVIQKIHRKRLSESEVESMLSTAATSKLELESLEYEVGYAELRFGSDFDGVIRKEWRRRRQYERLWQLSVMGGSLFSLLAIVFGYFKIDQATRGMYSVRLLIASGLLGMIALAMIQFALRQLAWI